VAGYDRTRHDREDLTVYHNSSVKKPTHVSIRVLLRHTRARASFRFSRPDLDNVRDSPPKFRRSPDPKLMGTPLAAGSSVTVIGEVLLVTSSVALSLGLSRLALGELFRLVRIDTVRPQQDTSARR